MKVEMAMPMHNTPEINVTNKIVAHYVQKMELQKAKQTGILDTGSASGAAPE